MPAEITYQLLDTGELEVTVNYDDNGTPKTLIRRILTVPKYNYVIIFRRSTLDCYIVDMNDSVLGGDEFKFVNQIGGN